MCAIEIRMYTETLCTREGEPQRRRGEFYTDPGGFGAAEMPTLSVFRYIFGISSCLFILNFI